MGYNPETGMEDPAYPDSPNLVMDHWDQTHAPTDGAAAAPPAFAMNDAPPRDPINAQFAMQDNVDTLPDRPPPPAPVPAPEAASVPPPAERKVPSGAPSNGSAPSKLLKDETAARSAMDTAQGKEADAVKAQAGVAAQQADADRIEAERATGVIEAQEAASQKRRTEGNALLQQKVDAASKMQVRDMFEGRAGAKIGAAIAMGLGAFGSAMNGGPNYAMQIVNDQMDRFRQKQLDAIAQAHKGVEDQKDIMSNARMEIAAQEEGMYKKIAAQRLAVQMKFGADAERAKGDAQYQGYMAKAAEKRAEWSGELIKRDDALKTSHVQRALMGSQIRENDAQAAAKAAGPGGKGATAEQSKYAILGQGLKGELDTIAANPEITSQVLDKLQQNKSNADSADKTASSGMLGAWLINKGRERGSVTKSPYDKLGPRAQVVANAWDNAIEKYARVLTGAGMPAEEAHRMALNNAPHAGDSHDIIKQKFDRLRSASDQFMSQAGSAAQTITPASPAVRVQGQGPPKPTAADMATVQATKRAAKPGSPQWIEADTIARRMQAAMSN